MSDHLSKAPNSLQCAILSFLGLSDHLQVACTCALLRERSRLPSSWCPSLVLSKQFPDHLFRVYNARPRHLYVCLTKPQNLDSLCLLRLESFSLMISCDYADRARIDWTWWPRMDLSEMKALALNKTWMNTKTLKRGLVSARKLTRLCLSENDMMYDQATMQEVIWGLENLESVLLQVTRRSVGFCENEICDETLGSFAGQSAHLKRAAFPNARNVTDTGVGQFLDGPRSNLSLLDVSGSQITDHSIELLHQWAPNITILNIRGCSKLTESCVRNLLKLKKLNTVYLRSCSTALADEIRKVPHGRLRLDV
jgi:Leucine-rich repeat (LRR) protein